MATTSRRGSHLFGWCITGHHGDCPHTLTLSQSNTSVACVCDCHTDKEPS